MFMIRSADATPAVSLSASPVVVVIPIPAVNPIPAGNEQFAADSAGMTAEKYVAEPATGAPAVS